MDLIGFVEAIANGAQAIFDLCKRAFGLFSGDFGLLHWSGQDISVTSTTPQHLDLQSPECYDVLVINDGPDAVDVAFPDDASTGWVTFNAGESGGVTGPRRSSVGTGRLRIHGTLTTGAALRMQYTWIEPRKYSGDT